MFLDLHSLTLLQIIVPGVPHDTLSRLLRTNQSVIHRFIVARVDPGPSEALRHQHALSRKHIGLLAHRLTRKVLLIGDFASFLELHVVYGHFEGSFRDLRVFRPLFQTQSVMLVKDESIELLDVATNALSLIFHELGAMHILDLPHVLRDMVTLIPQAIHLLKCLLLLLFEQKPTRRLLV